MLTHLGTITSVDQLVFCDPVLVFTKTNALKPYTAGKISTENLLDNVLTYISEHFCFYTLCIISAYKYVKKLRKCK